VRPPLDPVGELGQQLAGVTQVQRRAEVTWTINWSGGSTYGSLPPLTTTATTTVVVTELRAVITG
jgi:hypothetical protein